MAAATPLLSGASAFGQSANFSPSPLLDGLGPKALLVPLPQTDPSRFSFNDGWLFFEGDIMVAPPANHNESYLSVKAGNARGAAGISWDDSGWAHVQLPHDWASFQPFERSANVSQGYRPRGKGWYRRRFKLDDADRGKKLELQFGGIATACTIWLNGSLIARNHSAYNAILIDITPFARFGDADNVLAVRVDADVMEGWWYEGAGIYRNVWLAKRPPISIITDGVHCDPRLVDGRWQVPVSVMAENIGRQSGQADISVLLRDKNGTQVAEASAALRIDPLAQGQANLVLAVDNPNLWSIDQPELYELEVRLNSPDGADVRRQFIGFRNFHFDAAQGFFLNGQHVKIKGVCLHIDHACVGTAVPESLLAWRLARLKDIGCNAIRCSHNAQDEGFYALCDRMGFVVMDENRIFNPSPENMAQLQWLVRAHRNHPSIILWSVFNEEPMQGTAEGVEMVRRMRAAVRALDDSRPVTAAMNGSFYEPANVSQVVDVVGFNYFSEQYDAFHAAHPNVPITSSEDTSAFMTRGVFATNSAAHEIASMDQEAPRWGKTHGDSWQQIAARPFVAGGFVWTGFDYHGEPQPHEWPTISSFFGIMDLCGFAKTSYDIRRAQWLDHMPVIGLNPHWTWPGREGQEIDLLVSSNAPRVRLKLNGRVVADVACDRNLGARVKLVYRPGLLEAEALINNRVVARTSHQTAGPPANVRLLANRDSLLGNGRDVVAITASLVDIHGNHVPDADNLVHFTIENGTLLGVGNGDPNCHASEKAPERPLFHGLAQAIIQAPKAAGDLVVTANVAGLAPARITLPVRHAPDIAAVG